MIFSKSSPPDKLEYMRDIRLSPETLKKNEGKERSLKVGFDSWEMESEEIGRHRKAREFQKERFLKKSESRCYCYSLVTSLIVKSLKSLRSAVECTWTQLCFLPFQLKIKIGEYEEGKERTV